MELEERIAGLLRDHKMQWQRQGEWFTPTSKDVAAVLAGARQVLFNAPDNTEYDQAGILVRKEDGDMNIYVHIGKIK